LIERIELALAAEGFKIADRSTRSKDFGLLTSRKSKAIKQD